MENGYESLRKIEKLCILIYDVRIRQRTNIEIRIADTFLNTFTDKIEGALKDRHLQKAANMAA